MTSAKLQIEKHQQVFSGKVVVACGRSKQGETAKIIWNKDNQNQNIWKNSVLYTYTALKKCFRSLLCVDIQVFNENWPFEKGLQSWPQNVTKIVVSVNQMKIYLLVVLSDTMIFLCHTMASLLGAYLQKVLFVLHFVYKKRL